MSNFIQRQIANLALAIELSVLGAVVLFMVAATIGASATTSA